MKTESVPTDEPILDEHNARTHPERNLEAIKSSLAQFGQQKPIVVDSDGIVRAGNGTLVAARDLGWETIEIVRSSLAGPEAAAYAIADNKTTDLSAWDDPQLLKTVRALEDEELRLATGFDAEDLRLLEMRVAAMDGLSEDEPPPPPQDPRSRPGDIWILGDHRLLCGDATSAEDVGRLLDGTTPALCVTDPPYGVEYDPEWRNEAAEKGQLAYAASRVGRVPNDDRADWREAWVLFHGDVIYCWSAARQPQLTSGEALLAAGFEIRNQIIWSKPHFPISRGHYTDQHEPCWYAVKKGRKSHWIGDNNASTVWRISLDKNVEGGHGTQKPVECMGRPIRNHAAETVYDPFLGSGTTLVAAEQLGRSCYGMDIDPAYVDVAVLRWQAFTDRAATLDGDGRAFSDVAVARGA